MGNQHYYTSGRAALDAERVAHSMSETRQLRTAEKYAAAALMALATTLEERDTGIVPDKPSPESLERAQQIINVCLENIS